MRERLNKMRFVPADIPNTFSDRKLARGCGVWPVLVEKQRAELMNASLLGVYGIWQSKSGVRNLIAK